MVRVQRYSWLERGVQERGGFTPSHILSPFRTEEEMDIVNKAVREGD
jgi:hypothetical protein